MFARIYQPARNAMQSGQAKSQEWILEFAPGMAKALDPLMGWIGSGDMERQVQLTFGGREAAEAYAQRHGIPYRVFAPQPRRHILRQNGYGDNFAFQRRMPWTH